MHTSILLRSGLLILALILVGSGAASPGRATAVLPEATITIDATQPGQVIVGRLWGSNLTHQAPSSETVENTDFVNGVRQIGVHFIRWPGGNSADAYDWKRNEVIKPGRRVQDTRDVDIRRIMQFVRAIDGELGITVNFGTMNAQDAADLVEFLNGPADSPWGAQRAALGFPEPLNVRYFEIGNEENQPHMWYYSWTAENPEKYFFGGEEERRDFYNNQSSREYDPVGAKGDFIAVKISEPNQTYTLRFPPVRDVNVFWAASEEDARNHNVEEWTQVDDLSAQPPDAKVFTLEPEQGVVRFGDGVHGAIPPAGSYLLVEYTTYGHDGFIAFAQAMRAAPSSVPIQVGAAILPFNEGGPLFEEARMTEIFEEMDFYVRHQYNASFTYEEYDQRRQIATERVSNLAGIYARVQGYVDSLPITKTLTIAITEWNIFLDKQYWRINRTLEGGVIAAEWFARMLNALPEAPVANTAQFALHGGNLALIRTQTNFSIAPMGYVFQGFADWPGSRVLPVHVESPGAFASEQIVPFVAAAAALSTDAQTLRVVLVNNARTEEVLARLSLQGFTPASARLWRLTADDYQANNDRDPNRVVLEEEPLSAPPQTVKLPPHSVAFLELQGTTFASALHHPLLMRSRSWPLPTPTISPTATPTTLPTVTPLPSATPTSSPTPTPIATPTPVPTPTPTPHPHTPPPKTPPPPPHPHSRPP